MTFVSLFSGIDAASVAWNQIGWKAMAFAEIEPFPAALLAQRYPQVPNLGNVAHVDWSPYCGKSDVVVGGSPCQAFSVVGLRKSLEDPRGNLTLEYVRAVHAIRPRYAVWENVPGVLSTADNAFGCFLAALVGADEAIETEEGWPSAGMVCGPAGRAAWRLLDAQWFGLAQRRLRVFVVFCPTGGADPAEVLFERPRLLGNPPTRRAEREKVAGSLASRTSAGGGLGTDFELGGGLSRALKGKSNMSHREDSDTLIVAHALRADGFDASEDGWVLDDQGGSIMNCYPTSGPLGTLRRETHGNIPAIAFSSKDHGADAQSDLSPTLQAGGHAESHANAGVPPAIAYNLRGRDGGSMPEPTDVASIRAASGGSSRTYVGVRRLTPTECERLQGFPDGYTAIDLARHSDDCAAIASEDDDALCNCGYKPRNAKDGPRYKALGNSMAVPLMRWIGERIMQAEAKIRGGK